jgi:catechol 2,3-dioxygenase-like lactoylglutathione lyase family enzyme
VRIKRVAFTIQPVADVARARAFYERTLGLEAGLVGGQGDTWWIEYDLPGGGCLDSEGNSILLHQLDG